MTPNQVVALVYAQRGVKIFPCREADIGRRNAKAPYVEGGWHSASLNEAQVRHWWNIWPNAVIGLPCRMNGVVAIDADRHGQGDGVAALLELFSQNDFDLNSVPNIATPRSGIHCLFSRPIKMGDTKANVAPAIDIRDNGYVVAAGSLMADARSYLLCNGSLEKLAAAIGNRTLPEVPQWLAASMVKPATIAEPVKFSQLTDASAANLKQRLSGLVRKVISAPPGQRNATLHWAACRAGELVRLGRIRGEVAVAVFTEAGRQAGLPEREANLTARSGVRIGHASVRHVR